MKRIKNLLLLFILMFKIGLFTFGGGYAMIHILEDEFVSKTLLLITTFITSPHNKLFKILLYNINYKNNFIFKYK